MQATVCYSLLTSKYTTISNPTQPTTNDNIWTWSPQSFQWYMYASKATPSCDTCNPSSDTCTHHQVSPLQWYMQANPRQWFMHVVVKCIVYSKVFTLCLFWWRLQYGSWNINMKYLLELRTSESTMSLFIEGFIPLPGGDVLAEQCENSKCSSLRIWLVWFYEPDIPTTYHHLCVFL